MPYIVSGKCVYKKNLDGSRGKKVGCTKGSVKAYLKALYSNVSENKDLIGRIRRISEMNDFSVRTKLTQLLYERLVGDYDVNEVKYHGDVYHGTIFEGGDFFEIPEHGYSDWDVVWVASDEYAAEEFSDNRVWGDGSDYIQVIIQYKMTANRLAQIDVDLATDLKDFFGYMDFRELWQPLKEAGFEGWVTLGSIGSYVYDDYGLFDPGEVLTPMSMKFKIDNEWGEYMSLDDAEQYIDDVNMT